MKKIWILILSFVLVLSYSNFVYADTSEVPQEVEEVAIKSLDTIKGKITADPEKWGFSKSTK